MHPESRFSQDDIQHQRSQMLVFVRVSEPQLNHFLISKTIFNYCFKNSILNWETTQSRKYLLYNHKYQSSAVQNPWNKLGIAPCASTPDFN